MQTSLMRLAKYVLMMACALAASSPLTVWASGGTLTFVGAVVTPTCDVSATFSEDRMPTGIARGVLHAACPEPNTAASSEAAYSITKEELLAMPSDPLLAYFYGYATRRSNAAGQPPAEAIVVYL